jgi:hypothetical protein
MRFRCIIWYCPRFLGVIPVQRADYLYITHPCAKYSRPKPLSFDLHVLGTPPAFVLSQDQTLHCMSLTWYLNILLNCDKCVLIACPPTNDQLKIVLTFGLLYLQIY